MQCANGELQSSWVMRALKNLCALGCVSLSACVKLDLPDSTVQLLVQPVVEAMIVSMAAQQYRTENGAWPTNATEFSSNVTAAARMLAPTNDFPSIAQRSLTGMELRPWTNGSLFISYRPSLSSTGIVTLVVATNGGTTYPWAKNEKAESH